MDFQYEVIKSSRKSVGITISPNCIVKVRIPKRVSLAFVEKLLKERTPWIKAKLAFFQPFLEKKLENKISFLGKDFELIYQEVAGKRGVLQSEKSITVFGGNPSLQFEKWLLSKALILFEERFNECFTEFSKYFHYTKPILKIRKMKARWGSLSASGVMTLNLHLIRTPLDCIDYVIMHELCHLKHQNHGKSFHLLEETFTPNRKEINQKLKHFSVWLKG
jgi:predicted metal-dependent hydrolase